MSQRAFTLCTFKDTIKSDINKMNCHKNIYQIKFLIEGLGITMLYIFSQSLKTSGNTDLLRISSFLAVVLDEVHQAMYHRLHCYQPLLKLLPRRRRSIWGGKWRDAEKHWENSQSQYLDSHLSLRETSESLPGLGSMFASSSRWGRSLLRLAGSPVLCSAIVSSWTLWAKDAGVCS